MKGLRQWHCGGRGVLGGKGGRARFVSLQTPTNGICRTISTVSTVLQVYDMMRLKKCKNLQKSVEVEEWYCWKIEWVGNVKWRERWKCKSRRYMRAGRPQSERREILQITETNTAWKQEKYYKEWVICIHDECWPQSGSREMVEVDLTKL